LTWVARGGVLAGGERHKRAEGERVGAGVESEVDALERDELDLGELDAPREAADDDEDQGKRGGAEAVERNPPGSRR
jgi:hypothetical protein